MRLREGGFYRDSEGVVRGPMRRYDILRESWTDGERVYRDDGFSFKGTCSHLLKEVTDPNEIPRVVPVNSAGGLIRWKDDAPAAQEPRTLRVSVWCRFAQLVADVTVAGDGIAVTINSAWFELANVAPRIPVSVEELKALAVLRKGGHASLLSLIETRAREEAFA